MKKTYLTPQKKTQEYDKEKSKYTDQNIFVPEKQHKEKQQEEQLLHNEHEHQPNKK